MTTLTASAHTLIVFADDSGDDTFTDPGQPVFGFGGCAVLGMDLERHLRLPWREQVRQALRGNPEAQLHARVDSRRMSTRKEAALANFFNVHPILRFAALANTQTEVRLPSEYTDPLIASIWPMFLEQMLHCARWTSFTDIAFVLESSDRLEGRIEKATRGLRLEENGKSLPINWYWLPKSSAEPGLEVADFLAHTASGFIRDGSDPKSKFFARSRAMFRPADHRLAAFLHIASVAS